VGEFIRSAKAFAAEVEREKVKERSQRGIQARLAAGMPYGGGYCSYGYRWRDEAKSGYEIDPDTAPIVRRIFDMAGRGMSLRSIGLQLEAKGIPSPRGRSTWAFNSVRTILGCET
jgi:site-specific DNA recombinase